MDEYRYIFCFFQWGMCIRRMHEGRLGMVYKKRSVLGKKMLCLLLTLVMCVTPVSMQEKQTATAATITKDTTTDSQLFDEWTKDLFVAMISGDLLTNNFRVADASTYGVYEVPIALSGYSEEELYGSIQAGKEMRSFLKQLKREQLTKDQQELYDVLTFQTDSLDKSEKYLYYTKAFSAYGGIQSDLITTLTAYHFYKKQDYVNYLQLLTCVPQLIASAITYEKKRSELGLFISNRELDDVLDSMQAFINQPENNVLITTFDHMVEKSNSESSDKKRWKQQNRDIIQNQIIPAYQSAMIELEALRGTGMKDDASIRTLPDGKNYYAYLLKQYSGTNRTPKEYIKLFDTLSDQCLREMEEIKNKANKNNFYGPSDMYVSGTPKQYISLLTKNSKKEMPTIKNMNIQISMVDSALGEYVAPAYVMQPQLDEQTSFVVYINPAYEYSASFDTIAHEAYPGHLYQFVTMNQMQKNPLSYIFTNDAYVEGWASYVQSRAYYYTDASELYAKYMEAAMNYNNYQLYKLDLLIHSEGYSKAQSLKYVQNLGYSKEIAEQLYEHFITVPAYNMCYAAGQAELQLMINHAQETLGNKFNRKKFHTFYLSMGCASFSTIEERLEEWLIKQQQ